MQLEYNRKYNITPKTIEKEIREGIEIYLKSEEDLRIRLGLEDKEFQIREVITQLEKEMFLAAKNLQFEKAAQLRDKVKELKSLKIEKR
ncbi:MAG: UvrB/UvrC motif-containing protein [Candidatus Omnitrophica bacterium]|nr:UvrB/UvrC motif-containing protein [Candidatus Omnitrophota bacterium]